MRFNLSEIAVRNPAVVLFLIIATGLSGIWAYLNLGRAEDPNFTVKTMVVQALWPGATSDEVQRLVAEPLEKRLQEMPELDYVRTYSRPGQVVLQVQLKDSIRGHAAMEAWYQVRKKLGDSRIELPQGVIGPFFNDEYGDVFSAVYMLTGDGATRADLKRQAETLRRSLLRVPDVAKVVLVGDVPERIFIEISYRKLATLGIPAETIFNAIGEQNVMTSAGAIDTDADRIEVRVSGAFTGEEAIRAVPVEADGKTFRLGDIAEIRRGYEDPPAFLVTHRSKAAVGVAVAMAENANVLELGRNLQKAIAEIQPDIPLGIQIEQIADQPRVVEESVGEFLTSFGEALAIVLIVSFFSLGFRAGIVVALSVPLVLAIVFVVMFANGMNLDRITLGALIIALGLLVDDAIIAVEMMVVKIEEGFDRLRAAAFAWESTAFPMLTGTLVTAAGFLPVGFAKSTAGEYAGNIFWIVGLALIVSWIVAVVFTPYLGTKILVQKQGHAHSAHAYDSRSYRALRSAVNWSLKRRWFVIFATVLSFVASVAGMALVEQQFFPTSSRPELFIEVRMPEGTSIEATAKAAAEAEKLLAGDPDAVMYTTYIGQGSPRFFLALNPVLPNPSFALTVILTKDASARERLKEKLEKAVADGAVPQARLRIDRLNFGPPVGFPVQFRVVGEDPQTVREIAHQVLAIMRMDPRAVDPQLEWSEQVKNITLEVDQDRARAFGLNTAQVSGTLQTLLSGRTVSEYREGIEILDVVVRAVPAERLDPAHIGDLTILARNGQPIPLRQVATIGYGFEEPILWRRNRDLNLSVRSDVAPGVQAPTVTASLAPMIAQLSATLPSGYRIDVGGAVEETEKANVALFKIFPVMFAAMLTILMLQLRSFAKLFLVFLTAPLGLIGAVAALLVFDAPFGFVALLGVIALAGMIMRNSVILIDQIDHDLAAGLQPWNAIVESTVRRARPVVLTALAAILAMIPLARSVFWGPMAVSMMGGLLVATILTLLFLPALYAAWFRVPRSAIEQASPTAGFREMELQATH
jgi:multidrug efflux pump subunit AcrB